MQWTKKRPKINKPCILLVHNTFRNLTNCKLILKTMSNVTKKTKGGYYFSEAYNDKVFKPAKKKIDKRKGTIFLSHPWRIEASLQAERKKAKGNKTV